MAIEIIRARDYEDMSNKAARILAAQVTLAPRTVLGLATGSTPVGAYAKLIEWHEREGLDFSSVVSVNLDEYCGLPVENSQSYRYFMREKLFDRINIRPENTHLPNGLCEDAKAECLRYDGVIDALGGIDLQLLGIGHNGHIGFNEPADSFPKGTHRIELSASTIQANRRFFEREEDVPRFALTMGIGPIMAARHILMLVSGEEKAEIVARAFCGEITPQVPASVLQLHGRVTLVADEAALSKMR